MSFGDEIFFVTHGDDQQKDTLTFTGDGSKKLTILLKNDSGSSETVGGWYKGIEK